MRRGDGRFISQKQLHKLNQMRDLQLAWSVFPYALS